MTIKSEQHLFYFEFWSGAKCRAEQLSYSEFEQLEQILDEMYPNGIDATTLNDLFWFDFETICEWLGLELDDNGDIIRD